MVSESDSIPSWPAPHGPLRPDGRMPVTGILAEAGIPARRTAERRQAPPALGHPSGLGRGAALGPRRRRPRRRPCHQGRRMPLRRR